MSDHMFRALFEALVHRVGGVEAAAAVLDARYGKGCKGTISKMCNGTIGVTLDAAAALEDATQTYPITNRLYERKSEREALADCLRSLAAETSLATGQTTAAVLNAFSPSSPDPFGLTDEEKAEVVSSARMQRNLLDRLIEAAEQAGGNGGAK